MLTNSKNLLKTGLVVLALSMSLGGCGSSSGGGGTAGSGGTGGTAGGGAGVDGGTDAAAETDGGSDASDAAVVLTPAQVNDMIINATSTYGIAITRAAPTATYPACAQ